ncbi:CLUMA_CG015969, isoform A [Clunio marinus]|uniref:CLUMA_CG015969, isoform A n=1 Tax=Clunio marinus TaxID=568069 RepID=A0A1J1IRW1_9DIPT|nr:CLUMA_CG015969, isoform A [Clunio marinus]
MNSCQCTLHCKSRQLNDFMSINIHLVKKEQKKLKHLRHHRSLKLTSIGESSQFWVLRNVNEPGQILKNMFPYEWKFFIK